MSYRSSTGDPEWTLAIDGFDPDPRARARGRADARGRHDRHERLAARAPSGCEPARSRRRRVRRRGRRRATCSKDRAGRTSRVSSIRDAAQARARSSQRSPVRGIGRARRRPACGRCGSRRWPGPERSRCARRGLGPSLHTARPLLPPGNRERARAGTSHGRATGCRCVAAHGGVAAAARDRFRPGQRDTARAPRRLRRGSRRRSGSDAGSRGPTRRRGGRLRAAAVRAPRRVGRPLGRRGRPDRRRSRAAARRSASRSSSSWPRRPSRRGDGARRPRPDRARLPRPRLLGHGRLRPARSSRRRGRRLPGRCSSTGFGASRPRVSEARRRGAPARASRGSPPAAAATSHRPTRACTARDRPDPHRRAGGAHRRRRRLGRRLLPRLDRRRGVRAAGRGSRSSSRPPATGRPGSGSTTAGRGHIDGVIGPDEYHEAVDDNAFTNVMARWNLRRAASRGRDRRSDGRSTRTSASAGSRSPTRSSTATTRRPASTSSSPASSSSSRSSSRRLAPRRPIAAELLLGRRTARGRRRS